MDKLSTELYVRILDYLDWCDRTPCGLCCSYWYHEVYIKHARILLVEVYGYEPEELRKFIPKIPTMIKNPSQQLDLLVGELDESYVPSLMELLASVNYSVRQLLCSLQMIRDLATKQPDLLIHTTTFEEVPSEEISDQEYKLAWQHLVLGNIAEIEIPENTRLQSIPFYPLLSSLQKLVLNDCAISDVSMLGSVPHLSLERCPNLSDISALTHNRSITISECPRIRNYNDSFQHSEIIRLNLIDSKVKEIRWNNWKKVIVLDITAPDIPFPGGLRIPYSVKRCEVRCIDELVPINSFHRLQQLEVIGYSALSSLKNLGLDQLVIIGLYDLTNLSSLTGLGSGKNRKVVVTRCRRITDYSPLRYVHEVEIDTENNVQLDHLDHVHTLTITAKEVIVTSGKRYDQIHALKTPKVKSGLAGRGIKGLVRIPYLTFTDDDFIPLLIYLGEGEKLYCEKLSYTFSFSSCYSEMKALRKLGRLIWQEYLKDEYEISFDKRAFVLLRK